MGNLFSVGKILSKIGCDYRVTSDPEEIANANRIIMPGVGAFDHAIELLDQSGMRPTLETLVLQDKVPVLGICVGMQILASASDEGGLPGLGWVPGKVRAFRANAQSASLPLPHMGWNDVQPKPGSPLFVGLEFDARFYFLHSYFFDAQDRQDVAATANYGLDFDAVVSRGHIHGVQCHPEKSHHWGEQILKNFVEL